MNDLDAWSQTACQALGLDPAELDRDLILDLTRDVAHGVARPAAPLTAYLVGLSAGRNGGAAADVSAAVAAVRAVLPTSPGDAAAAGGTGRPRGQSPGTASG
jgi:hypothetical protein